MNEGTTRTMNWIKKDFYTFNKARSLNFKGKMRKEKNLFPLFTKGFRKNCDRNMLCTKNIEKPSAKIYNLRNLEHMIKFFSFWITFKRWITATWWLSGDDFFKWKEWRIFKKLEWEKWDKLLKIWKKCQKLWF